jgi:hypothetical protein
VGDADDAEDVRLEHGPQDVGGELRGAGHGVVLVPLFDAGAVDQYVEPAVGLDGLRGGLDGDVVGDVELDEAGAELLGGAAAALGVPGTEVDGVACGAESAGGLEAKALVGPGDECGRHVSTVRRGGPDSQQTLLPGTRSTRQRPGRRGSLGA